MLLGGMIEDKVYVGGCGGHDGAVVTVTVTVLVTMPAGLAMAADSKLVTVSTYRGHTVER